MKGEYIKIISLLIALFYINILEINNFRRTNKKKANKIDDEEDYVRFLKDIDYTEGRNIKEDKESIENCKNLDENYFSAIFNGETFKFKKYVDKRDSVSFNYL